MKQLLLGWLWLVACQPPSQPPTLTSTLARDVTSDYQAIDPTTTFHPTETIHLLIHLGAAERDAHIKVVWTAVAVAGAPPNQLVAEHTSLVKPTKHADFTLTNAGPWPEGHYQATVYLNNTAMETINFYVKDPPP